MTEHSISGGYPADSAGAVVDVARSNIDWVMVDARSAKEGIA